MSSVRVLATGLEFPEGPVVMPDGSVLLVEIRGRRLTRVWPDGSKQVVAEIPGGPNGAAIAPDGRCIACNNGGSRWHGRDGRLMPRLVSDSCDGGWIEAVDPATGAHQILYRTCLDVPLTGVKAGRLIALANDVPGLEPALSALDHAPRLEPGDTRNNTANQIR